MSLHLVPVTFADACAFVAAHHRHHEPPVGHKFSIGVAVGDILVGVAMVGRPRALGYGRLITYTQADESGASLRAAGWRVIGERSERRGWWTPSRPRTDRGTEGIQRTLWEAVS